MNKICGICQIEKLETAFNRRSRGGLRHECKECGKLAKRVWERKNPTAVYERSKKQRLDDPAAANSASNRSRRKARVTLVGYLRDVVRIKRHTCKKEFMPFDLTTEYLVEIYNSQNGRCALTGRYLTYGNGPVQPNSLSVDRIDHTNGYVEGNVRLVTFQINAARGIWSDEALIELSRDVLRTIGHPHLKIVKD